MKNLFITAVVLLTLTACTGGNGGGTPSQTHNQLANTFVDELYLDGYNVTLMKSDTNQRDYIVVYDSDYGTYDAIDISQYDPNYDYADNYYSDHSYNHYYGLDYIGGNTYEDYYSGITFEKTTATKKDLAKISALVEEIELGKTAEYLSSDKFGLSLERAKSVARLALNWKKASKKGMTDAEHDNFSTELLGFSITTGKAAVKKSMEGNSNDLKDLIQDAATANDITPEHANGLMTQIFGL